MPKENGEQLLPHLVAITSKTSIMLFPAKIQLRKNPCPQISPPIVGPIAQVVADTCETLRYEKAKVAALRALIDELLASDLNGDAEG